MTTMPETVAIQDKSADAADTETRRALLERVAARVLDFPRPLKRALAVGMDSVFCAVAVYIAFYLRLDQWSPLHGLEWLAVIVSIFLAIPIFIVSGLYRAIFRYAGVVAMISIVQAALVYGLLYAAIITIIQIDTIPRTVGLIQPVVLFLLVAASRAATAWALGGAYMRLVNPGRRKAVMIYGAGSAGRQLHQALASSDMRVMGFIDDAEALQGQLMMGQPVYSPAEIEALVEKHELTDILLAIPSVSRKRRTQILELIRPLGVAIRTVPGVDDVARGRVRVSDLRELDIDDLLGREAVAPDETLLDRNLRGKTVLVSGAGGSIGSELCRQIMNCAPATLLLVEVSEAALYSIHHELDARERLAGERITLVPLLASVLDEARIRSILAAWNPDTIYHAAAYKHVPLVEHNPIEGVRNNVFGTLTLAQLASEAEVSDFVLISTDKAVRPTNVMGTTKRLAEQVLQAIAQTSETTHYSMVRFGNVLGSSGSVVPLFRKQIAAGGPITITHPKITRYFMTIPEAAQLVIQAGAMGKGGEVFVLDMGDPVKIVDLARMMVELSGLTLTEADKGEGDIELSFVGLRPGEKLYEELLIGNRPEATSHPRIMRANEHFMPWGELRLRLNEMQAAMDRGDVAAVVDLLKIMVPEYTPDQQLVDWVHMKAATGR